MANLKVGATFLLGEYQLVLSLSVATGIICLPLVQAKYREAAKGEAKYSYKLPLIVITLLVKKKAKHVLRRNLL